MKRMLIVFLAFWLLAMVVLLAPLTSDAADISGKTFTYQGCSISFVQGPFGPGEGGTVTVTCGQATCMMNYTYQDPVLMVYDDETTLKFAYADYALWYLDPVGPLLTEQK